MIIGSGSISFEMVRYLVERLPVMVCPRWIYSRIQPIAVDDLLEYLVAALDTPGSRGRTIEIGGEDVTTYRGLMLGYAQTRGLRRLLLPVPVLTPRLSSYWVHWMTPIPAGITEPLVEGLRNDVIVTDGLARDLFPRIAPRDYVSAIKGVIGDLEDGRIDTSWSDASGTTTAPENPVRLESRHGMIVERRRRAVAAPPRDVYRVFTGIGADRGWYFASWAWRLRGAMDRLLGGAGLRRGRRHPDDLRIGDALDFWRVEDLQPDRLVRLRAEMKLPGRALAPVRGVGSPGRRDPLGTDRGVHPQGARRPGLLVRPVPPSTPGYSEALSRQSPPAPNACGTSWRPTALLGQVSVNQMADLLDPTSPGRLPWSETPKKAPRCGMRPCRCR